MDRSLRPHCSPSGAGRSYRTVAVLLVAVVTFFTACATPGSADRTGGAPTDERSGVPVEILGGVSPFSALNILRSGRLQIAVPPGWALSRVGDTTIYAEPPDESLVLTVRYSGKNGAHDPATSDDLRAVVRERCERTSFAGRDVTILFRESHRTVPQYVLWDTVTPPLSIEFRGIPERIEARRDELLSIAASLRLDPFGDSVRIVEGRFAFHGFGTGWEYITDLPGGALFGFFPDTVTGDYRWDTKPEIAVAMQRGAAAGTDAIPVDNADTDGTVSTTVPDGFELAGGLFVGPTTITTTPAPSVTVVTIAPGGDGVDEWRATLFLPANSPVDRGTAAVVRDDPRLQTFWGGCFAAIP